MAGMDGKDLSLIRQVIGELRALAELSAVATKKGQVMVAEMRPKIERDQSRTEAIEKARRNPWRWGI